MDPVPLPITNVLDLHPFRPQDVRDLLVEYLDACRQHGIFEVRVVHGKGIGQLRQTVHAVLRELAGVERYALAGEAYGGSGATIVTLRGADAPGSPSAPG